MLSLDTVRKRHIYKKGKANLYLLERNIILDLKYYEDLNISIMVNVFKKFTSNT